MSTTMKYLPTNDLFVAKYGWKQLVSYTFDSEKNELKERAKYPIDVSQSIKRLRYFIPFSSLSKVYPHKMVDYLLLYFEEFIYQDMKRKFTYSFDIIDQKDFKQVGKSMVLKQ